jgi:hypothetical protein
MRRLVRAEGDWVTQERIKGAAPRSVVTVDQSLNDAPRLVWRRKVGDVPITLLDPNPRLATFVLGHVKPVSGRLPSGARWKGRLYLPTRYKRGKHYPLVIQSEGPFGSDWDRTFSLYGPATGVGLGPAEFGTYAAQILASRQIATLELTVETDGGTPSEPHAYMEAFEATAEELSKTIADRRRIGLLGFSRNGFYVAYALSHSNFPFAAAIINDSINLSYLETTLLDSYSQSDPVIGDRPFGQGLAAWLANAPGFRADRIRTPLRIVNMSYPVVQGALANWEIYARLRHLNRPVEMYFMPLIDRYPSHRPQNPSQLIAVQRGSVDWFDFWLNGHERTGNAEQYDRWRALRKTRAQSAK